MPCWFVLLLALVYSGLWGDVGQKVVFVFVLCGLADCGDVGVGLLYIWGRGISTKDLVILKN